ncbi:MAG TPA: STAS domain-containing protein [Thermoanaerobaculia bacterium]|nr:STAS domain-containing protein [Thermoanaerobaculia bacterium]
MNFETRQESGWTVVAVGGRLDTTSSAEFDRRGQELVAAGSTRIVLDLSELEYVSSAGLRAVLTTAKSAQAAGGKLAIAGMKGVTKEVFSISGFDSILPTYADVPTALAS